MSHRPDVPVKVRVNNEPAEGEEAVEGVSLSLAPSGISTLKIRRGGVETHKTCSLIEFLEFLDRSLVLNALALPPHRTGHVPPLPPRTLLVSTVDFPEDVHHLITGWMPPARYPFVLRDHGDLTVHSVPLPALVYRAHLGAKDHKLRSLSLTLAPGFPEDGPVERQLETPLYRYPFSNVYGEYGGVMEACCWPTIGADDVEPSEIPEKGVHAFLSIPNNAHLYGVGTSHNAPHADYRQLLEAVDQGGLKREWLIPAQMDARGLHHQTRKKGLV